MKTLDTLNQKIELLIKQYKQIQTAHSLLVKEYEKQLKKNEKFEQTIKSQQQRIDELVLQQTIEILTEEQKKALKKQLAIIVSRIDNNLKLL
jgi:chromosome segregation ATPase